MSRCIGCGAILQTTNELLPGYIPPSADAESKAYCKRCFMIRHHNLDYSLDNLNLMSNKELVKQKHYEYMNLLQNIKNENCLVLLMIDALDIYTGFIPDIKRIVGNNPVWILANKADLYPKDLKLNKIKEKIEKISKDNGIDTKNVFFISCYKEQNVDVIMERMFANLNKKHYPSNNIYIIGSTSVGKSTFINLVLKKYAKTVDLITTSMEANTTTNLIKIGVGKNHQGKDCYLIDTPGYLNERSILSCAPLETLKLLVPKNFIRVKTYQLKEEQTIYLGGLVRMDFKCEKLSASFYVSDKLYIHRTKTINAEKAYENLKFKEIVPPFNEEELKMYGKNHQVKVKVEDSMNIWLSGIGIVHIKGMGEITITNPEMVMVTLDYDELS